MTSPYLNPRATPSQLSRWADWMLSSRFVGIMTADEVAGLQRMLAG